MDIHQLRGWAEFMDKGMIASLVLAAIAVAALGTTTLLSIKYKSALRTQENAAFDRYKAEAADHVAQSEKEVASARERTALLEKSVADAGARAARAERHAVELEKSAEDAQARVAALETEAANARVSVEKAEPAPESPPAPPVEPDARTSPLPKSPLVESLAKFAGAHAAIYTVDDAADAAEVGSSVNTVLTEAGWAASVWKWAGVSGIVGLVVLTKEGNDRATDEAAAGLVDAFRAAGFNAAKADWPADWRRYRGTLDGPETPAPTEAPIRIVIGTKSRQ